MFVVPPCGDASDMTHTSDPTEPREDAAQQARAAEPEDRSDRPDQRRVRGNPAVEEIDVERGEGKIERVLGW
jgi:hypothetical protein